MNKRAYVIAVLFLLIICVMPSAVSASGMDGVTVELDPSSPFLDNSFFGIWIGAFDDLKEATVFAYDVPAEIGVAQVFLSSDWSELNQIPYFVVTAGMYASRPEAELMLLSIQYYYPDAYIKYAGVRLDSFLAGMSEVQERWIGTWKADNGEMLVINDYTDTELYLVYYGYYADGKSMFESPYTMYFTNESKTTASEAAEVIEKAGWRRELELKDNGTIIMHSRYPDQIYYKVGDTTKESDTPSDTKSPFYGVWCSASKDYDEALRFAEDMNKKGLPAKVFVTTDWSNLNSEKWYVVTAGVYATEAEANEALKTVKITYPDAYVKYSGWRK